jgi:hypothetical protein
MACLTAMVARADAPNPPANPPYGQGMMMRGGMMGPGMMMAPAGMQPMTPQQYQQWYDQWQRAQQARMGQALTPEQYSQWWQQMHRQGYGPGMMHNMTPEQRQQMWEYMHGRAATPAK